jgi:hypothetical protein
MSSVRPSGGVPLGPWSSPFRPGEPPLCALGWIRTSDSHLRKVVLYPLSYEGRYKETLSGVEPETGTRAATAR